MSARQAFTLVEVSAVLTCLVLLMPIVYHFATLLEEQHALALWHLETAEQVRDLSEELRLDARRGGAFEPQAVTWTRGECVVQYRWTAERTVTREASAACGGPRVLARDVERWEAVPGGVEVVFARWTRPDRVTRTRLVLPVERP